MLFCYTSVHSYVILLICVLYFYCTSVYFYVLHCTSAALLTLLALLALLALLTLLLHLYCTSAVLLYVYVLHFCTSFCIVPRPSRSPCWVLLWYFRAPFTIFPLLFLSTSNYPLIPIYHSYRYYLLRPSYLVNPNLYPPHGYALRLCLSNSA